MKKNVNIKKRRDFFSKMFIVGTGSLALVSISGCSSSSVADEVVETADSTVEVADEVVETADSTVEVAEEVVETVDSTVEGDDSTTIEPEASSSLSDEQKDHLFYIYQEEKVARDVYITLGEIYPDENTFASIQKSEQRHIDSARALCDTYNVETSHVEEDRIGEFEVQVLQELYNTCIDEGEKSLLDALKIGELIEITDIDDLEKASVGMPEDVVNTYNKLKEGSYNHLDAFQTAIKRV